VLPPSDLVPLVLPQVETLVAAEPVPEVVAEQAPEAIPAVTAPPAVEAENTPPPDFVNTNASKPLPNALGVLGGLIALALAGGAAGAISYNNANLSQARVASARAEFFGTGA